MIEADLEREYRRDLADLWRGRMTPRKLWVLIRGLPPDGPTARRLAGVDGPLSHWRITDALLGRLVDETAAMRWEWERAHIDQKDIHSHRDAPASVLPTDEMAVTAPEVEGRTDIPVVSPHRLGGFVHGQE